MQTTALSENSGQTGFVNGLIAVASRLVRLLELETSLLRDMRPGAISELQDEKMRLVRGYESMASEIREDPERLAAISDAARQELRNAVSLFEEAAENNARALAAAQDANERLLKAIVQAATDTTADTKTYASDGGLRKNGKRDTKGISLTINQEL
jgi:flagellar biosynthesis/type III secretory pathway chaperone